MHKIPSLMNKIHLLGDLGVSRLFWKPWQMNGPGAGEYEIDT